MTSELNWTHVNFSDPRDAAWIRQESGLAPIIAEALLSDESRPRALHQDDGILVILRGVNLNAGSGTSYASYQWNLNGAPIAAATSATFAATSTGSYSLTVTDANGCSATSNTVSVTIRELPVATITGNSAICQGGTTQGVAQWFRPY